MNTIDIYYPLIPRHAIDEYDFAPIQTTVPVRPVFDWAAFKAGAFVAHCDKNQVMAFLKECGKHGVTCGDKSPATEIGIADPLCRHWKEPLFTNGVSFRCGFLYPACLSFCYDKYYREQGYTIIPYPFPAEPEKREPVMLYCVKDYNPGDRLTKGKIYTMDTDGRIEKYDNGRKGDSHCGSFAEYKKEWPDMAACLVECARRPAQVGETMGVTESYRCQNETKLRYTKGDILTCTNDCAGCVTWSGKAVCYNDTQFVIQNEHYVVLLNYAEQQPNKYAGMSNEELRNQLCGYNHRCAAENGRHADCPLMPVPEPCLKYITAHPKLRPTLIQYCLDEDAQ